MRRLFALLTVLVALVALAVPSAAASSRGFVAHPSPLLLLQDNGHYVRGPCLLANGSTRTLVCRPDVGVLPQMVFLSPPAAEPFAPTLTDLVPDVLAIAPGLPPPRRA